MRLKMKFDISAMFQVFLTDILLCTGCLLMKTLLFRFLKLFNKHSLASAKALQGVGHDDYQDQAQQGRETLLETRRVLHLCVDLGKLLVVLKVVGQKNY